MARLSSSAVTVSTRLRTRSGLLAVSAGGVLWGTTGVAVHVIVARTGMPVVTIGCYRAAVAAVFALLVLRAPGTRAAAAALRRRPVRLLVCGAGFGAYQAFYFVGVRDVGVSVSTLVSLGVAPIALTLAAALRRRSVPPPASLVVLACAVVGLALISLAPGTGDAPHPVLGVLASLASGLGYAGITAYSRGLSDVAPLVVTGVTSAVGALVLLPFALGAGLGWPADGIASGWLVYIGVVPTVLAYALFYRGLRTTPPEVAGVLTLLEPLTATLLAAATLHESLSPAGVAGALLMLLAITVLYARGGEPQLAEVEAPPPP